MSLLHLHYKNMYQSVVYYYHSLNLTGGEHHQTSFWNFITDLKNLDQQFFVQRQTVAHGIHV
jgi:hypothetical protein